MNQDAISIEYNLENDLYEELERLLSDNQYAIQRGRVMRQSVIEPDIFEEEVKKLIMGQERNDFCSQYEHIDTEACRKLYLDRLSEGEIFALAARKNIAFKALKYFPFVFIRGIVHKYKK